MSPITMMLFMLGWMLAALDVTEPPRQSQTPPTATADFPADARVGFVNLQVVLSKSVLGQRGSADLKKLTDERDADIQAKTKAINDLQARLSGPERQTLDPATRAALVNDLNRKRAELNFDRETWQARVEQASEAMLVKFRAEFLPVVDTIRSDRGLLFVFTLPARGIVAADPRLDLSAEVIRRLDEKTK